MTNPDQSSASLLQMALRGDEGEWDRLHELCQDRQTAGLLAQALEQTGAPVSDNVRSWAQVLEEMHSGLKVNLPPD